jgi:hypothetical protein
MKAMKTRTFAAIAYLAAVIGMTLPAYSQVVRIQFRSEVTEVTAPLLAGVTVGSIITGLVEVNLAHLPLDSYPDDPSYSFHSYSLQGIPGYIFQFDTGIQTFTLDSVNAAGGLGVVPAISLLDFEGDLFDMAARDAGNPCGAVLAFSDFSSPATLLSGDYFPEDINLAAGLAHATFKYADFLSTNAVVARVTSASMLIEQDTQSALLIYRVRVSSLPEQRKRPLIATLQAADTAFGAGQCETGLKYLRNFQNKVRAQVARADSVLADHLIAGAQAIIDSGCGN